MGSLVISMHGLNACLHRPQSRVCCATCVSRHCIHHTAGCRRRKRSEEVETGSRPERRGFRYTQCFFSAALVSSAQCVHAHAHAQRPEYYRRSSACNSCNRVTKPRKTQKKRTPVSLCLTETVCTSCTHGLPAYREQVAGVRGCRPKTGGYAVAAGPADGN